MVDTFSMSCSEGFAVVQMVDCMLHICLLHRHQLHCKKATRTGWQFLYWKYQWREKNKSWTIWNLYKDNGSKWLKSLLPIQRGRQCEEIQCSCEKPSALSRKDTHLSSVRATFSAVLLGGARTAHLLLTNHRITPHDLKAPGMHLNWNWDQWIINSSRICSCTKY